MEEKKSPPSKQTEYRIAWIGGITIIFMSILLGVVYPILGILGEIWGLWLTTQKRTHKEKSQGYLVTPLYKRPLVLVGATLLVFWNVVSISAYNDMQKKQAQTAQQAQTDVADPQPAPATDPAPEAEKQPATPATPKSDNPLMKADLQTADVKNGTGDKVIGKRGYIKIDKAALKSITNEQFTEFANKKVNDSGLNWVSIICEDGTGICFVGSVSSVADYGTQDSEGKINKQIGVIMLEENGYTYEETAAPATPPAPAEPEKPKLTKGQENALGAAEHYLAYTAFSHAGLVEQLEFEGYSTEDAKFAADNCGADWNQQAVMKAAEYLNFTNLSRSGLVDQLKFEGFTADQAEYGADAMYK